MIESQKKAISVKDLNSLISSKLIKEVTKIENIIKIVENALSDMLYDMVIKNKDPLFKEMIFKRFYRLTKMYITLLVFIYYRCNIFLDSSINIALVNSLA